MTAVVEIGTRILSGYLALRTGRAAMQQSNATREESIYRLLVIPRGSHGFFGQVDGSAISLPRVHVPPRSRPAGEIRKAVRDSWGVDILVLDFLESSDGLPICAVAESLSRCWPEGLKLVTWESLPVAELDHSQRKVVNDICIGNAGDRGPFSRVGWIEEAKEWIAEDTGSALPQDMTIEQHNAGGRFTLLCFVQPGGSAYWLKATGEPNLHELDVTVRLAAICPQYLPRLIATRREWNAWLMEDVGDPLNPAASLPLVERAAVAMAELQKKTLGHTGELLAAGATDQRLSVLCERVDEHIGYLEEAMEQQTSSKAPRLSSQRLREIGSILGEACVAMEALGIPDTVIHNDLNCGNILVREGRCTLTDWSEASVGNPFLSCQGLLLLVPHDDARGNSTRSHMMQAYKRCWIDFFEAWKAQRAFQLMPLLAVYSHLYGRGGWMRSARSHEPGMQSYARSLARIMDREARSAFLKEALCQ